MRRHLAIFIALFLVTLGQAAIDMYLPSLPKMAEYFEVKSHYVQLTMTYFLIGYALSQLIYGPLSDRWGRKPILIFGMLLFLASSFVIIFSASLTVILISRLGEGLGIGACNLLARVVLKDMFSERTLTKMMSYIGLIWVMVPVLAPLLGGYLQTFFGWRSIFVCLFLLVAFSLFLVIFFLPETKKQLYIQPISFPKIIENYRKLLGSSLYNSYIFSAFLLYGVFVSFYTASPFLLQTQLGLAPDIYGWILFITLGGYMLGSFLNSRIVHQEQYPKIIKFSLYAMAIAAVNYWTISWIFPLHLLSFMIPLFFLFLFMAFIYPNCISGSLSIFPEISGSASALFGCSAFLGGTAASVFISYLPENTQIPFSSVIAGQCLLTFWIFRKYALQ